jgi:hypothetical protein
VNALLDRSSPRSAADEVTPDDIARLAGDLAGMLASSMQEINKINQQVRLLSFNAQIEAARAGETGAAFGVVAHAMSDVAVKTADVAKKVAKESDQAIHNLETANTLLSTQTRGNRLSDIALVNIDLVDRNLYERSCDVRWWATDSSLVRALTERTPEALKHASERMGVILGAYTVYFDLVLADLDGNIVANGRPLQYNSVGSNRAKETWFRDAVKTKSGDEFGFQSVHVSSLVNGERVLVYSCSVREGGRADGRPLGVLGIVFRWDALAQTIVNNLPLSETERSKCRACFCNEEGFILADSQNRQLIDRLEFIEKDVLFAGKKNYLVLELNGKQYCVGHARSPGFETYATGWHSLVLFQLD